jgi:hypothetical protein
MMLPMWGDMHCEERESEFYLYVCYELDCLNFPFYTANIGII